MTLQYCYYGKSQYMTVTAGSTCSTNTFQGKFSIIYLKGGESEKHSMEGTY